MQAVLFIETKRNKDYATFCHNFLVSFGEASTTREVSSAISIVEKTCSRHSSRSLNKIQIVAFQGATDYLKVLKSHGWTQGNTITCENVLRAFEFLIGMAHIEPRFWKLLYLWLHT